jgi:hypothetical protein
MPADYCLLGCDAVYIVSSLQDLNFVKYILNSWPLYCQHSYVLFKDPTALNGILVIVLRNNNKLCVCVCRTFVSKCSLS